MMKTFCEYCNKFVDTLEHEYNETIEVKGLPINYSAIGSFCNICGNQLFNRDLDNDALLIAYREYRKEKGLLQPEDIKKIRTKYGLSQVAFAKLLGFGEKTIARYESGSLQDDAPNSLIFLMDKPSNMIDMLKKYGESRLDRAELQIALNCAKELIYFEVAVYKTIPNSIDSSEEYLYKLPEKEKTVKWRSAS